MRIKKKKVLMGTLVLALIVSVGAGVYSYFYDKDEAENTLTIGAVNTEIVENFMPPKELTPGTSFTKDVKVQNLGPTKCFVRVKAVFTDSDMGNLCEVDFNTTPDSDGTYFVYNEEDGYYYYVKPLEVGEISESLFTTVTVKETYDKDGDGNEDALTLNDMKAFDILIYQEAYQSTYNDVDGRESREFTDYVEAWEYYRRNKPNS